YCNCVKFLKTSLGMGCELPYGFDLIAEELQSVGRLGVRRKDIQNSTTAAELAGQLHGLGSLESVIDQPAGQIIGIDLLALAQGSSMPGQLGTVGDRLDQRLNGGKEVARRVARFQLPQNP